MRRSLLLLLFALTALPAFADTGAQRQAFLDAEAALKRGDRAGYDRLLARLDDYPLRPYLVHADLTRRLSQRPSAEVHRFLAEEDGTVLGERLRGAWLERLATLGDWPGYLEFHRPDGNTATDCRRRHALLATGRRDEALDGLEAVWLTGRSLPDACDPLLDVWRAKGLTPELIFERLRLALEAGQTGLAGYLAKSLPEADRVPANRWIALHRNPERLEGTHIDPASHPRAADLLRHAYIRHTRNDPQAAAALWDARKAALALPVDHAMAIEREIALRLALRRLPEAGPRMARLDPQAFDTTLREWQARRAIAAGDWAQLAAAIQAMDPAARAESTWRYWEARALEAQGEAAAARPLYEGLAEERHFYGFLAADRIRQPYRIGHRPTRADEARVAEIASHPAIRRAKELYTLGRTTDARREWASALGDLDKPGREIAAMIADRLGWHDRAIVAAARAEAWDDINLRFPIDHRLIVAQEAQRHEINPAWAFAVIRQESAFLSEARSSAGAVGLMQIMPATAKTIAARAKVNLRGTQTLLDPAQNIRLGTWYLRHNLDQFGGNPVLASAAYNAGSHRVRSWLPADGSMEADAWIETIPFNETREYVKRVMTYKLLYEIRLGMPPTQVGMNLAPIAPRDDLERTRLVHIRSFPPVLARGQPFCDAPGYTEAPCS